MPFNSTRHERALHEANAMQAKRDADRYQKKKDKKYDRRQKKRDLVDGSRRRKR